VTDIQPIQVSDQERDFAARVNALRVQQCGALMLPAGLLGPDTERATQALAQMNRAFAVLLPAMATALGRFGLAVSRLESVLGPYCDSRYVEAHRGELSAEYFQGYLDWRSEQGLDEALRPVRLSVGAIYV